jgi:membrane protease YdiL (CAAX protease family)
MANASDAFHPIRGLARRHPIVSFFALALGITWVVWIPVALSSLGLLPFHVPFFLFPLAGYGPSLAGVIMAGADEGKSGIKELLGRLLLWRVGVQWYVFVLLSTPLVAISVALLSSLLGGEPARMDFLQQVSSLVSILPILILLGGPVSEELGWRGFALPKLLTKHSALASGLIVGVIWGLWHLPAFWIQGAGQHGQPILWFMVGAPAVSILYTWVYAHTEGSLLIAILYHTAFDSTLYFTSPAFPGPEAMTEAFALAVTLLWLMALVIVALFGPQLERRRKP